MYIYIYNYKNASDKDTGMSIKGEIVMNKSVLRLQTSYLHV